MPDCDCERRCDKPRSDVSCPIHYFEIFNAGKEAGRREALKDSEVEYGVAVHGGSGLPITEQVFDSPSLAREWVARLDGNGVTHYVVSRRVTPWVPTPGRDSLFGVPVTTHPIVPEGSVVVVNRPASDPAPEKEEG